MNIIKENAKTQKKTIKMCNRSANTYNLENPKKFKKIIRENRISEYNSNVNKPEPKRNGISKNFEKFSYENKSYKSYPKKKITLFKFRKRNVE